MVVDVTPTTSPSPEAGAGNPFVQDLLVYDDLRTIDSEGELHHHWVAIVTHLDGMVDRADAIELAPGLTFAPVPEVGAKVFDRDGDRRDDAEAVVGLVEDEAGATFGVLSTVEAEGERQLGSGDQAFFDMSFVGDTIGLGDVVSADFTLVQLLPTGDATEEDLDAVALAAHRAADEQVTYTATEDGDDVVLPDVMGRIVAGSEGPSMPMKAQDTLAEMFDFDIKDCGSRIIRNRNTLGCLKDYFDRSGDAAQNFADQLDEQLDPDPIPTWTPPPPPPPPPLPPPPPPCTQPPCGRGNGDPWVTTFDGHPYGMHAVGELVFARHPGDGVEVQIRTHAVNEDVSMIDRVAVAVGDSRVHVGIDDLVIDGNSHEIPGAAVEATGEGFTLVHRERVTAVDTDHGHRIWIQRGVREQLTVVVAPAGADGAWEGLLGDANGVVEDDLRGASGAEYPLDLDFATMYEEFVPEWRVTDGSSLFDYGPGESTATFTDLAFPAAPFGIDDLDPGARARAEAVCAAVGIEEEPALTQCIIDLALTDELDFVEAALVGDRVDGVVQGRIEVDVASDGDADSAGSDGADETAEDDPWALSGENVLGVHATSGTAIVECTPPSAELLANLESSTSVRGDGVYATYSGVCAAALHAGVIEADHGGVVEVRGQGPGPDGYPAVDRNGVRGGSTYDDYPWAFTVVRLD